MTRGTRDVDPGGARAARVRALRVGAAAAIEALVRDARISDGADDPRVLRGVVAIVMRVLCARFAHVTGRLAEAGSLHVGGFRELVRFCEALGPSGSLQALTATGAELREDSVARALEALDAADPNGAHVAALEVEDLGAVYEALVGLRLVRAASPISGAPTCSVEPGDDRRRAGAHYTSRAVTTRVVAQTLAPLLALDASPDTILALRVCDPAMGSGAFLIEANRQLAIHLADAWATADDPTRDLNAARLAVASRCLYGVDKDPLAVELARFSVWYAARGEGPPFAFRAHALCVGDALVGQGGIASAATEALLATMPSALDRFDWGRAMPEVFAGPRGGFDAIVGNPPWVSYAGRAAQPLDPHRRAFFEATSPAFHGYRNLHGLFVHRAATLLRPGGRLGLVVPTSMSDLAGYAPSRRAHDELCRCDDELADLQDGGFEGVFQPCMALCSTRRASRVTPVDAAPWPLERADLDADTAAILVAIDAMPRLPAHLFGERGYQSTASDTERLRAHVRRGERERATVALRTGTEIEPAHRRPPRIYCDPAELEGRLRPAEAWRDVKLLLRQTARYPMAALSDGLAFRNSVLAGFADAEHDPYLLVAYLNSAPVRFYHYMRHRDARQGMPQLKIGHLRALPAPARGEATARLAELGRLVGERNTGITRGEQAAIDDAAADALALGAAARARIATWAAATRG